ncbi:MAG: MATE family efflux transporter [Phycisphaerales bacterium]|nr:MATE family efflux transporter [Phycisphaerales bacterium]
MAMSPDKTPIAEDFASASREVVLLAAPTIATMLSYTAMQFADALMVSRITPADPVYLAAQGNGGIWAFVPMTIYAGLCSVVNTYVAQNLGAGTPERGAAYVWNALWIGVFMWVVALLPLAVVAPYIFGAMHGDKPRLVEFETHYCQILLVGGIFNVVTRGLSQFFYGLHRPGVVLAGAIVGNIVNLGLNWVFIYGNLGAPAMGVAGSALATVIATMVEAAVPAAVFLSARFDVKYRTRSQWRPSARHIKDILRLGWPASVMFANELVCWAIFMTYIAGQFGTNQLAAGWIALRYMHTAFLPAVGLSFALTASVGKCLGAGRPDLVVQRAKIGILIAMVYMGACAIVFVVFRHELFSLFLPSTTKAEDLKEVMVVGAQIMLVAAVFQVFDALGISLIGILRGAGDTVWPGVLTIVLSWTCIIGGGFAIAEFAPKLGSVGPWIAAAVYIMLLGLGLLWRFWSGKWRTFHVLEETKTGAPSGEPGRDTPVERA